MEIGELQSSLRRTYYQRDSKRGRDGTFRWMTEEVGELARALRHDDREYLWHEFGDVLAWLTSLANLSGVDLEEALHGYWLDVSVELYNRGFEAGAAQRWLQANLTDQTQPRDKLRAIAAALAQLIAELDKPPAPR